MTTHPNIGVAVDIALFTLRHNKLHLLLVERGEEPFKGHHALPGGFIHPNEDAAHAALREITEETGIGTGIHLEQFFTYTAPTRDPRTDQRVVSIAHFAIAANLPDPAPGTDAANATWAPVADVLNGTIRLAFDHHTIATDALDRVQAKFEYTNLAVEFLPDTFTIPELRDVYAAVWGNGNYPNFRRKVTSIPGLIEPTNGTRKGALGPAAQLYRAGTATAIEPPFYRRNRGTGN